MLSIAEVMWEHQDYNSDYEAHARADPSAKPPVVCTDNYPLESETTTSAISSGYHVLPCAYAIAKAARDNIDTVRPFNGSEVLLTKILGSIINKDTVRPLCGSEVLIKKDLGLIKNKQYSRVKQANYRHCHKSNNNNNRDTTGNSIIITRIGGGGGVELSNTFEATAGFASASSVVVVSSDLQIVRDAGARATEFAETKVKLQRKGEGVGYLHGPSIPYTGTGIRTIVKSTPDLEHWATSITKGRGWHCTEFTSRDTLEYCSAGSCSGLRDAPDDAACAGSLIAPAYHPCMLLLKTIAPTWQRQRAFGTLMCRTKSLISMVARTWWLETGQERGLPMTTEAAAEGGCIEGARKGGGEAPQNKPRNQPVL
jgi:hypothetical protein